MKNQIYSLLTFLYVFQRIFSTKLLSSAVFINNCEILATDEASSSCLRCREGYLLSSTGLDCIIANVATHSNCIQIGLFEECIICECGYSLGFSSGRCVPTPVSLEGCQKFDGQSCIQPKQEFEILINERNNGIQSQGSIQFSRGTNCEIRVTGSDCLRCHHGYQLNDLYQCIKVPFEIVNSYYSFFEGGTLQSRDFRFVALENGVYPIIESCVTHALGQDNTVLLCLQCEKNRVPNESKTNCNKVPIPLCGEVSDSDRGKCMQCDDPENYYLLELSLEGKGQTCVSRKRNQYGSCLEYESNYDRCSKCRKPFKELRGICVLGEKSEEISSVQNCAIFKDSKTCLECEMSYTLTISGFCILQTMNNCLVLSDNGKKCLKCKMGYIFSNDLQSCSKQFDVCIDFDVFAKKCKICAKSFYLHENGRCQKMINCKVSNGIDQKCLICHNLLYPMMISSEQITCVNIKNIKGCYLSDGVSDECLVCNRNYKLIQGECKPFVLHNGRTCEQYGFYIHDPNEEYCYEHSESVIENCWMLEFKLNSCKQCQQGFYPNKEGVCTPIPNCDVSEGFENYCLKTITSVMYASDGVILNTKFGCETDQKSAYCLLDEKGYIRRIEIDNFGEQKDIEDIVVHDEQLNTSNCLVFKQVKETLSYECVYCHNMFYVNQNGECEEIDIPGCHLNDGKSNWCLYCSLVLIVDKTTGRCVEQQENLDRCQESYVGLCHKCDSLFYPQSYSGLCISIKHPTCIRSAGYFDRCMDKNEIETILPNYFTCELIDSRTDDCEQCFSPYILKIFDTQHPQDINYDCIQNTQTNCKSFFGSHMCQQCDEGYFKSPAQEEESICQKITQPHCLEVKDHDDYCIRCEYGFTLSNKGNCFKLENCQAFDSHCTECASPYILNHVTKICVLITNCVHAEFNKCLLCDSSFYVSQTYQECLPVKNCISSFGEYNECEVCEPSFVNINQECVPEVEIEHCIEYGVFACQLCSALYFINSDKTCSLIDGYENCSTSDGITNLCTECSTGGYIIMDGNTCEKIPNCAVSDGINLCLFCNRLFYRNHHLNANTSNSCVKRQEVVEHCVVYDPNEDRCEQCENLYFLSNDNKLCTKFSENLISNCIQSTGISNSCLICQTILKNSGQKFIFKQLRQRSDHFELNLKNCFFEGSIQNTQYCSANYYLREIKQILNTIKKCARRENPQTDNCRQYYRSKNECEVCESGFRLRNSVDLPFGSYCERIPVIDLVENCSEYDDNSNVCRKCRQSDQIEFIQYWLDKQQNRCVNILKKECTSVSADKQECLLESLRNCEYRKSSYDQRCYQCKNHYYLENNLCRKHKRIKNCHLYDTSMKDSCYKCEEGYQIDQFHHCQMIFDPNCQIQGNTSGECLQCKNGYALINSKTKCFPSKQKNCLLFQEIRHSLACIKCNPGFELDNEQTCVIKQSLLDPNCMSFGDYQVCKQCKVGYFLNSELSCLKGQSACSLNYCMTYRADSLPDSYKCQTCVNGYKVNSANKCIKAVMINANEENDDSIDPMQSNNQEEVKQAGWIVIILAIICIGSIVFRRYRKGKQLINKSNECEQSQMDESSFSELQCNVSQIEITNPREQI